MGREPRKPDDWTCPVCPEHGDLAQLAGEPQPGECPICHQPIGREHTDYCRLTGPVSALPILDLDSFTSRTSTPPTQARGYTLDAQGRTHAAFECHDPECTYPRPHTHPDLAIPDLPRTPGYDGPEGTEWPRTKLDPSAHVWGQDTHYPPRGQGDPHHISQCGSLNRNCPLPPAPTTDDNPR